MTRLTNILTLVLALQLLLVAGVFWPRSTEGEGTARSALLELSATEIDRIAISDNESSLLLSLTESGWQLPEYHKLPVDGAKVARVLEDLPALSRGWPVASTGGAKDRFEVADNNFQRKVEFFAGEDESGSLYLGTSPGFRKVHTRIAGSDPIYAVEFNTFDLPVQPGEWLDKTLLQVRQVDAITGLDYRLRKEGDTWSGDSDSAPEQAEVDKLFNGLTGLRVTAAADIATAAVLEEMNAPATLTVNSGENRYEYRLFEIGEAYYIQRSDIPVYFSLGQFDYDRLNDVNAATLYSSEDDGTAGEGTGTTGEPVAEG